MLGATCAARAGVELTPWVTMAFQTYLDGNLRGKHGRVRYDLRKHFGVTPQDAPGSTTTSIADVRPEVR